MRVPVLAGAATLALLALALPSSAAEATPTEACAAVEGAAPVTLAKPASVTFTAPALPGVVADTVATADPDSADGLRQEDSSAVYRFVLDASGAPLATAKRSLATVDLSWDTDTDYDMVVTDEAGRELGAGGAFNPVDGSGESVTTAAQAHCKVITVEVRNYVGAPGEMTLGVKVSGHRA